jgi:hypothetical protein
MLHTKSTFRPEICARGEPPWTQGFPRRFPGFETAEDLGRPPVAAKDLKPRRAQRGLRPQPKNGSHKATKMAKKSATEIVSYLRGFVASCESQVFVLQGFASGQNLRKKTRFEQVVVRRYEENKKGTLRVASGSCFSCSFLRTLRVLRGFQIKMLAKRTRRCGFAVQRKWNRRGTLINAALDPRTEN